MKEGHESREGREGREKKVGETGEGERERGRKTTSHKSCLKLVHEE